MKKLSNRSKGKKKEKEFAEALGKYIKEKFPDWKLKLEWMSPKTRFQDNDALGMDVMHLYHDKNKAPHLIFAQVRQKFAMASQKGKMGYAEYRYLFCGLKATVYYVTYANKKISKLADPLTSERIGEFWAYKVS